ncbi:cation:dicarboxylate symporter family transporter [Corynebacterium ulceribovis]|uniref:dicarboxylate/amino acid:cation symporter n=1 Tax=Corynebacterium ulceribovis TaxID=487732 RepID=UPI00035D64BC
MANSTQAPAQQATAPTDTSTSETKNNHGIQLPGWLNNFGVQIGLGLVVGLVLGFIAKGMADGNWLTTALETVGDTYVQLLKVMIPPLIVTAVITSVANLRKVTNAARLAGRTLLWFMATSLVASLIGIAVGFLIRPGLNSSVSADAAAEPSKVGSWWAFVESLIPDNILGLQIATKQAESGALNSTASFAVLQLLVVSLVLGVAIVQTGAKAQPVIDFMEALLQVVQKVLWWIIRLAPIGTAALIGTAVATYGWDALGSLGKFAIAIYVGLFLVALVEYPAVLLMHGLSPMQFYRRVWPVTSLGFLTRSSLGVMPVTQRITEQGLGVPGAYASFAVPFGATSKMDGCAAIYPAIAAMFVADFYGMHLGLTEYALIVFVSVIGSAATAGTTGATVMLTLTLSTVGLPLAGVGLLLAVDPIVDMGRTALNVTGQALVPAVVAKQEGVLDEEAFNSRTPVATDA